MKTVINILLFGFAILLLTSCASREPKIVYITKYKTKYIHIPEQYYKDDITLPKPISLRSYILADPITREKYNTKLIIDLYKTIGKYKIKLYSIGKYEKELDIKLKKLEKQKDTK